MKKKMLALLLVAVGLSGCASVESRRLSKEEIRGVVNNLSYVKDRFGNCMAVTQSQYSDSITVVLSYVPNCEEDK